MSGITRNRDLGFFDDDLTKEAILRLSECKSITLFVGAGASLDLNLPTWSSLVAKLLEQTVARRFNVPSDPDTARMICDELVKTLFQVQSASLVDSYLSTELKDSMSELTSAQRYIKMLEVRNHRLRECLYEHDHLAGIARKSTLVGKLLEVAILLKQVDEDRDVHIITTNYDNAIEEASLQEPYASVMLRDGIKLAIFADAHPTPDDLQGKDVIPVVHIHGLLRSPSGHAVNANRPHTLGQVVFSEADYMDWETGCFRHYLRSRVTAGGLLTIGASLRDNNVLTHLREGSGTSSKLEPRYALLPSQDDLAHLATKTDIPEEYWSPFLDMAVLRGHIFGLQILRPDFHGQVFQFLQELGVKALAEKSNVAYIPYSDRIRNWANTWSGIRESELPSVRDNMESSCRELAEEFESLPHFDHCKIEVWARRNPDDRTMERCCSSQSTRRMGTWPHTALIKPLSERSAILSFIRRSTVTIPIDGESDRRWTHSLTAPVTLTESPWSGLPVGAVEVLLHAQNPTSEEALPYLRANADNLTERITKLGVRILTPSPWSTDL